MKEFGMTFFGFIVGLFIGGIMQLMGCRKIAVFVYLATFAFVIGMCVAIFNM